MKCYGNFLGHSSCLSLHGVKFEYISLGQSCTYYSKQRIHLCFVIGVWLFLLTVETLN